jgi:peptidoglycan/LPS O-acetylase OafA/YrhL
MNTTVANIEKTKGAAELTHPQKRGVVFHHWLWFLLPTSNADPQQDIAALDGLRGVAILLVLVCHSEFLAVVAGAAVWYPFHVIAGYAYSGVLLFFVLSGFLLFLPFVRSLTSSRAMPRIGAFYKRRMLRIFPLYYLILLLTLLALVRVQGLPSMGHFDVGQLLLCATLLFDLNPTAYGMATRLDPVLWSLTLEWQFYLMLPWIALLIAVLMGKRSSGIVRRRRRTALLIAAVLGVLCLGLGTRVLGAIGHYVWGYASPVGVPGVPGLLFAFLYGIQGKYLEVFALGMLSSVLYVLAIERSALATQTRRWIGLGLVIIMVLGQEWILGWALGVHRLFGWNGWENYFPPSRDWSWSIFGDLALAATYALLLLGILISPVLSRMLSWPALRFVGTISYSMYLWHYFLISTLVGHDVLDWPAVLWSVVTGPATVPAHLSSPTVLRVALLWLLIFAVSTASYFVVERPFLRLRHKVRTGSVVPSETLATTSTYYLDKLQHEPGRSVMPVATPHNEAQ